MNFCFVGANVCKLKLFLILVRRRSLLISRVKVFQRPRRKCSAVEFSTVSRKPCLRKQVSSFRARHAVKRPPQSLPCKHYPATSEVFRTVVVRAPVVDDEGDFGADALRYAETHPFLAKNNTTGMKGQNSFVNMASSTPSNTQWSNTSGVSSVFEAPAH